MMPIISEDVKILDFKLLELQNYLAFQLKTKLEKHIHIHGLHSNGHIFKQLPTCNNKQIISRYCIGNIVAEEHLDKYLNICVG